MKNFPKSLEQEIDSAFHYLYNKGFSSTTIVFNNVEVDVTINDKIDDIVARYNSKIN